MPHNPQLLRMTPRTQSRYRAEESTERRHFHGDPGIALLSIFLARPSSHCNCASRKPGVRRDVVATRNLLYCLMLSAFLAGLAGCSTVSQRVEERRPFFQPEYELTSHGRKTQFDRIVELDPGGLHVKVASDYQSNAPLRVAVL